MATKPWLLTSIFDGLEYKHGHAWPISMASSMVTGWLYVAKPWLFLGHQQEEQRKRREEEEQRKKKDGGLDRLLHSLLLGATTTIASGNDDWLMVIATGY